MSRYSVKEIFYSLQGEGYHQGRAAVFCRFSGCNLWSGREQDRTTAICQFCDTDFIGVNGQNGGKFESAHNLAQFLWSQLPDNKPDHPYVICTGGEPLLQLDAVLIEALHQCGFEIGVETNGTQAAPAGIDWLCVSPKLGSELILTKGNELKLIYPQTDCNPSDYLSLDFEYFYLQAKDDANYLTHRQQVVNYCLQQPQWRLSLQIHKILAID